MPGVNMKIFLGSDHAGLELKRKIAEKLIEWGHSVDDIGTKNSDSCDYPDFAHEVCRRVLGEKGSFGILICGSGIGMSMAANRHPGIRAALCRDGLEARLAREHNDANVLALGARLIGEEQAMDCLKKFLETPFAGGRHERRVKKIEEA